MASTEAGGSPCDVMCRHRQTDCSLRPLGMSASGLPCAMTSSVVEFGKRCSDEGNSASMPASPVPTSTGEVGVSVTEPPLVHGKSKSKKQTKLDMASAACVRACCFAIVMVAIVMESRL